MEDNGQVETCKKPEYVGDTFCDDVANNAVCKWDGGDCCNNDRPGWNTYCKKCQCLNP